MSDARIQVIVHIGDAKCGSSAIQASLFAASEELLTCGVLYHAPQPNSGHFSYITLLKGKTRGNNEEQQKIARNNIVETRDLISKYKPNYLVLSGESLFNVPPSDIIGLCQDIIGTPLKQLHVIAFLRHPVELYLSSTIQTLKASHEFNSPLRYARETPATFRRWRAFSECTSLTVRLMDRAHLAQGSVVAEFRNILRGFTGLTNLKLEDHDENVSLSAEQAVLLQRFRRDFLPNEKDKFCVGSNRLVRFFEKLNTTCGLVGVKPTLKPEVESCILQKNLQFMHELDEIFPELGMVASRNKKIFPWGEASKLWTGDLGAIIEGYDPMMVTQLEHLIPEYNQGLAHGDVTLALKSLSKLNLKQNSYGVFANYMNWCRFPGTATVIQSAARGMAGAIEEAVKPPSGM